MGDDVLAEIIREGELRLNAQLSVATAADQRAMTWAGFLVAVCTAALGGAASLYISGKELVFALIAVAFAVGMFIAAWTVIDAIRPKKYFMPGNLPENWLPEDWYSYPSGPFDLREARIEQARCLNNGIDDNAKEAEVHALALQKSMDRALFFLACAGLAVLLVLISTAFTMKKQVAVLSETGVAAVI